MSRIDILGRKIDPLEQASLLETLCKWGKKHQSRSVCICNVHSLVSALRLPEHAQALDQSDLNTPDGMPLVWILRRNGYPQQERIAGPDLMYDLCTRTAVLGLSVYFYGSTERILNRLVTKLCNQIAGISIAGYYSPPFRALTPEEDKRIVRMINDSGAAIVFVGLGCPKQEIWIAEHKGKINSVMLGVGAAFDFHAGIIKRAPAWVRKIGFEWFHRLLKEPKRLWRRYLYTNSIFLWFVIREFFHQRNRA
jgi:N-acetylglucosaminyldiphosphoundecaprenol N-acetyl-beta-D-mannosaminyltransferase